MTATHGAPESQELNTTFLNYGVHCPEYQATREAVKDTSTFDAVVVVFKKKYEEIQAHMEGRDAQATAHLA
jgi:hypothetical protein